MLFIMKIIVFIQVIMMLLSGARVNLAKAIEAQQDSYTSVEDYLDDDIVVTEYRQFMTEFRQEVEKETGMSLEYIQERAYNEGINSEFLKMFTEAYGIDFLDLVDAVIDNDVNAVITMMYERELNQE